LLPATKETRPTNPPRLPREPCRRSRLPPQHTYRAYLRLPAHHADATGLSCSPPNRSSTHSSDRVPPFSHGKQHRQRDRNIEAEATSPSITRHSPLTHFLYSYPAVTTAQSPRHSPWKTLFRLPSRGVVTPLQNSGISHISIPYLHTGHAPRAHVPIADDNDINNTTTPSSHPHQHLSLWLLCSFHRPLRPPTALCRPKDAHTMPLAIITFAPVAVPALSTGLFVRGNKSTSHLSL
jgi:hypothetical protein